MQYKNTTLTEFIVPMINHGCGFLKTRWKFWLPPLIFLVTLAMSLLVLDSWPTQKNYIFCGAADYKWSGKLITPAVRNDISEVQRLVEEGADLNERYPTTGTTPLMASSAEGNTEIVRLLLDKGAEANAVDQSGATALMYATTHSRAPIVKLLMERGADVNVRDKEGGTALSRAMKRNRERIVKLLKTYGAKQ